MTLSAYYDELEKLDWYYSFSDDHNVYMTGKSEYQRLHDLGARLGAPYEVLWTAWHDYMFPQSTSREKPVRPFDA